MASQQPMNGRPADVFALGCALSAALVVLFVTCLLAALIFPTVPLAHAWVSLFTPAPITSIAVWIEGLIASVALGWLVAIVAGVTYNRIAA